MKRHDLVIVGGGTAGLVSGMVAGWAGARVALVEAERTGGDCLWTGCVPSKSLIAAADLAQRIREGAALGVSAGELAVDFPKVMTHVHASQELIEPHDSPDRLREAGVEYVEGRGRYLGPGRIDVDGTEFRWRTSIVATGSRPALPPVPGLAACDPLTSDTVWDLTELPTGYSCSVAVRSVASSARPSRDSGPTSRSSNAKTACCRGRTLRSRTCSSRA